MRKVLFIIANGYAALLDFGVGVLITAIILRASGFDAGFWQLVAGGMLALLPDFDIIFPLLRQILFPKKGDRTTEMEAHHATIFHRPVLMLPVVTGVAWMIGGGLWAFIAFPCLLAHFIHDTPPLSTNHLNWFWPIGGFDRPTATDHWTWIETKWLQMHARSTAETWVGGISLLVAGEITGQSIFSYAGAFAILGLVPLWAVAQRYQRQQTAQ